MEIEFAFRFEVKLVGFELNFEVLEHFDYLKSMKLLETIDLIQSFHI